VYFAEARDRNKHELAFMAKKAVFAGAVQVVILFGGRNDMLWQVEH